MNGTANAGRIERRTMLPSGFAPRRISVLLPPGYDRDQDRRYPVIYAQDGQNAFSPGGAYGSWDLDVIATEMMEAGGMPPCIVVAIDNSTERNTEFVPEFARIDGAAGRGGAYLDMLGEELLPYIDATYRTMRGAPHRAHIGSSLAGLLGYYAATSRLHLFGTVAALSPSFWVAMDACLRLARRPPAARARLWIDSGHVDNDADGVGRTLAMRDALVASGSRIGTDFMHLLGFDQGHREAAWRDRLPGVLRWIVSDPTFAGTRTMGQFITERPTHPWDTAADTRQPAAHSRKDTP